MYKRCKTKINMIYLHVISKKFITRLNLSWDLVEKYVSNYKLLGLFVILTCYMCFDSSSVFEKDGRASIQ